MGLARTERRVWRPVRRSLHSAHRVVSERLHYQVDPALFELRLQQLDHVLADGARRREACARACAMKEATACTSALASFACLLRGCKSANLMGLQKM
eukprot:3973234-Pleurochrysis_carterae.AAC.4